MFNHFAIFQKIVIFVEKMLRLILTFVLKLCIMEGTYKGVNGGVEKIYREETHAAARECGT